MGTGGRLLVDERLDMARVLEDLTRAVAAHVLGDHLGAGDDPHGVHVRDDIAVYGGVHPHQQVLAALAGAGRIYPWSALARLASAIEALDDYVAGHGGDYTRGNAPGADRRGVLGDHPRGRC